MRLTSIICAILTFFMAALHLALLFGAPIGEYVLGGNEKVIPIKKRWLNILFAILFVFFAALYLGAAGVVDFTLSRLVTKIIMGIYTVFLAYAIIGNIFFTKSKKEKYLMIPASSIGFITSLLTFVYI